jgi:LmbE family N-acetylglucosaminyl deacetylase
MTRKKKGQERIVLVMAHPDDAELAAAGTVALWVAQGDQVHYLICTSGDKGSKNRKASPFSLAEAREKEQREAAKALGVKKVVFLRYKDGELEHTRAFRDEIALVIRQFKPSILVTHDPWRPYQLHPDHRAVGFAATDAIVAGRDHLFVPAFLELGLEPHSPAEIYFTFPPSPDLVVDITPVMEKKFEALARHKSQIARIPDWKKKIRHMASVMAAKEPFKYGESFKRLALSGP